MRQYDLFEKRFKGSEPKDSCMDVELAGIFELNGEKKEVRDIRGRDTENKA